MELLHVDFVSSNVRVCSFALTMVPSRVQSCSLACNVCLQLARKGFAIVLISRSQEKLDEMSKAICKLFTNPVIMFHLTLSQTDGKKKIQNQMQQTDVVFREKMLFLSNFICCPLALKLF